MSEPRLLRYGLYARTAAGGVHAVEAQVVAMVAEVARRGGVVITHERDVNLSGAGEPAPGLQALLAGVDAGHIDIVGVTSVDRLGRSLAASARIVDRIRGAGAVLAVLEAG